MSSENSTVAPASSVSTEIDPPSAVPVCSTGEPENASYKSNDQQLPGKMPAWNGNNSAEDSSSSHLPVPDLFAKFPPNRQRLKINKRRHRYPSTSTSASDTTASPPSSPTSSPTCSTLHNSMRRFRPPCALRRHSSDDSASDAQPDASSTHHRFTLSSSHETSARLFSSHFPENHQLEPEFVESYQLEDELGSGGYGFVMTARDRDDGLEVAVKFIIKDKVPEHSWIIDPTYGKLPMEVVLLSYVSHDSIVKCLDVFEDPVYFYLVQELHGSPWNRSHGYTLDWPSSETPPSSSASLSTPSLSPTASETSLVQTEPRTPPHFYPSLPVSVADGSSDTADCDSSKASEREAESKPEICRRPSYDLFECIEQSEQKRLTEDQARYVFGQVVDAVEYLDALGVSHRDIKDENLVIDQSLKIKLIDFGSATIVDPTKPRPYYDQFYGTAAYASSEILMKKKYQAAPAEVWTLGVLLSYLVAGVSPFPTVRDAVDGKIFLSESLGLHPSESAMDLMRACLDPNPESRITIAQIKTHPWLREGQAGVRL